MKAQKAKFLKEDFKVMTLENGTQIPAWLDVYGNLISSAPLHNKIYVQDEEGDIFEYSIEEAIEEDYLFYSLEEYARHLFDKMKDKANCIIHEGSNKEGDKIANLIESIDLTEEHYKEALGLTKSQYEPNYSDMDYNWVKTVFAIDLANAVLSQSLPQVKSRFDYGDPEDTLYLADDDHFYFEIV